MSPSSLPTPSSPPRVALAGDRDIAVDVLDQILDDAQVVGLLLSDPERASHDAELRTRCAHLPDHAVFRGPEFRTAEGTERLRETDPDFLLCVHFPYLVPDRVLGIPHVAPLNLHPAYLPYNRGWHTPSWALLDDTPYGATLHVMTDALDAGPIVHRERLSIRPEDTAHTLYQRVKALEARVFDTAWPLLCAGSATLTIPDTDGTEHAKADLHRPNIQRIDPDERVRAGDLLTRLRALTTNRLNEAAYVDEEGTRYRIQVSITPEPNSSDT